MRNFDVFKLNKVSEYMWCLPVGVRVCVCVCTCVCVYVCMCVCERERACVHVHISNKKNLYTVDDNHINIL